MIEGFERYQRQLILDGWGHEVQRRLKEARVFIAGIGGLGCPVALNLALAGVGHLRICDADTVEITNLNRQFLHCASELGTTKTVSASQYLGAINPDTNIEGVNQKITSDNVDELVGDCQIIIDCLDNFSARYAINQCAIRKKIPLIHGAVWGMEGRIGVFQPPQTPCLACIFPRQMEPVEIPVLGAVTSATGSMQAIQAIRYLAGREMALKGRLLVMDFSTMKFQELTLKKDPSCPDCGK